MEILMSGCSDGLWIGTGENCMALNAILTIAHLISCLFISKSCFNFKFLHSSMAGVLFGLAFALAQKWLSKNDAKAPKEGSRTLRSLMPPGAFILSICFMTSYHSLTYICFSKPDCTTIHAVTFFIPVSYF